MNKKLILIFISAQLILSCSENKSGKDAKVAIEMGDSMTVSKGISYKDIVFDLPKDPACGMPLTAGVSDTAHYKGKVYGFCAKECKDEFLKNPASYLATK